MFSFLCVTFVSKVQVASPYSLNVFKAFMVVLYFALSIYFTLSVYSLYMIIKIQKKSVTTFLDHDFEGAGMMQKSVSLECNKPTGQGSFYHTLEEDEPQVVTPYRLVHDP